MSFSAICFTLLPQGGALFALIYLAAAYPFYHMGAGFRKRNTNFEKSLLNKQMFSLSPTFPQDVSMVCLSVYFNPTNDVNVQCNDITFICISVWFLNREVVTL